MTFDECEGAMPKLVYEEDSDDEAFIRPVASKSLCCDNFSKENNEFGGNFRPVTIKYYNFDSSREEVKVRLKQDECQIDIESLKCHLNAEHFANVE